MSSPSSSRDPTRDPLLPRHSRSSSYETSSPSASASTSVPRLQPPSSVPQGPPQTRVSVTIRFASSSLPDLNLTIPTPYSTNISHLKRLIRSSRPVETGRRRLRLIYGGKVLSDKSNIGQALGVSKLQSPAPIKKEKKTPPPPKKGSRKGKEVIRPEPEDEDEDEVKEATGVYVHCSIGDELTDEELAKEVETESQAIHHPSTLPAPQGFDRLLNAGFTESDIAALRSQFHGTLLNNTSASIDGTATADNNALQGLSLLDEESRRRALALEERWIDESAANNTDAENGTTNEGGGLEDTLIGVMWGFFWPLCIVWMLREDGVLGNSKRQLAVVAGLLMNCVFGLLRLGSAS
ncbi:hypothetical protein ABW19_dt0210198 [Dactylella cylindrospora]|nr:hypothetical protein ABW19_dt0210198 [Dactylella cylindrospora]